MRVIPANYICLNLTLLTEFVSLMHGLTQSDWVNFHSILLLSLSLISYAGITADDQVSLEVSLLEP